MHVRVTRGCSDVVYLWYSDGRAIYRNFTSSDWKPSKWSHNYFWYLYIIYCCCEVLIGNKMQCLYTYPYNILICTLYIMYVYYTLLLLLYRRMRYESEKKKRTGSLNKTNFSIDRWEDRKNFESSNTNRQRRASWTMGFRRNTTTTTLQPPLLLPLLRKNPRIRTNLYTGLSVSIYLDAYNNNYYFDYFSGVKKSSRTRSVLNSGL